MKFYRVTIHRGDYDIPSYMTAKEFMESCWELTEVGTFSTFDNAVLAIKTLIKLSGKDYHRVSMNEWWLWNIVVKHSIDGAVWDKIVISEVDMGLDRILIEKL